MDLIALQDREVKKHVGAVHVSGRLSLMQRKMSNVLLINAYEEMLDKDVHRIAVKDLAEIVGFDSNNRKVLKDAVKSLMSLVLEWNILDERGGEGWEAMPMLAYAAIKGGYCSYAYPERLKYQHATQVLQRLCPHLTRKPRPLPQGGVERLARGRDAEDAAWGRRQRLLHRFPPL